MTRPPTAADDFRDSGGFPPGCTAEDDDRELGCALDEGHPPPHADSDGTEFVTADQHPAPPDELVQQFGELPLELTAGLTTWGVFAAAQLRLETTLAAADDGTYLVDEAGGLVPGPVLTALYLSLKDETPRSTEDGTPFRLPADDARRLRDLLNIATARGIL